MRISSNKLLMILVFLGMISIFGIPLMFMPDILVKVCGLILILLGVFAITEIFTNKGD